MIKEYRLTDFFEFEDLLCDNLQIAKGFGLNNRNEICLYYTKSIRLVLESDIYVANKVLIVGLLLVNFDQIILEEEGTINRFINTVTKKPIFELDLETGKFYYYP